MIKITKSSLILMFSAVLMYGCSKDEDIQQPAPPAEPVVVVDNNITATTKKIMDATTLIKTFVSDTTVQLSEGISSTILRFKRADNLPVSMVILEVDMKNPKITIESMSPYNDLLYGMQPIMDMAKDNEVTGSKVIAAINGDVYNTTTGEPTGVYYIDGLGLKTAIPAAGGTFFSVYKDKTMVIGGKDAKGVLRTVNNAMIQYAVGGKQWLVDSGAKVNNTDVTIDARTAIGFTSNNVVYAVVVDGGQVNFSNGMSLANLTEVMASFGVIDAINLDGGTSSTAVVRDSSGAAKWNLLNRPTSAKGRSVGNGLGFILKN